MVDVKTRMPLVCLLGAGLLLSLGLTMGCAGGDAMAEVERSVIPKDALLQARFALDDGVVEGPQIDLFEDRLNVFNADGVVMAWWPVQAHLPLDADTVFERAACDGVSDCTEPARAAACTETCACPDLGIGWWQYDAVVVDFESPSEDGARLFIDGAPAMDAAVTQSYCDVSLGR